MICFVDGGYDNIRKRNGYGSYAIFDDNGVRFALKRFDLPDAKTSNQAEYLSLLELLGFLESMEQALDPNEKVIINSDSQLMVRQILGTNQVLNPGLVPLHKRVALKSNYILQWVPRIENVRILGH